MISTICPIGKKIKDLKKDKAIFVKNFKEGSNKARKIAENNLNKIKEIVGFIKNNSEKLKNMVKI